VAAGAVAVGAKKMSDESTSGSKKEG
jgi:hypothetical protein